MKRPRRLPIIAHQVSNLPGSVDTAIADAAVIPSPDEATGEVPKAFVVLRGEITPEAGQSRELC